MKLGNKTKRTRRKSWEIIVIIAAIKYIKLRKEKEKKKEKEKLKKRNLIGKSNSKRN